MENENDITLTCVCCGEEYYKGPNATALDSLNTSSRYVRISRQIKQRQSDHAARCTKKNETLTHGNEGSDAEIDTGTPIVPVPNIFAPIIAQVDGVIQENNADNEVAVQVEHQQAPDPVYVNLNSPEIFTIHDTEEQMVNHIRLRMQLQQNMLDLNRYKVKNVSESGLLQFRILWLSFRHSLSREAHDDFVDLWNEYHRARISVILNTTIL